MELLKESTDVVKKVKGQKIFPKTTLNCKTKRLKL